MNRSDRAGPTALAPVSLLYVAPSAFSTRQKVFKGISQPSAPVVHTTGAIRVVAECCTAFKVGLGDSPHAKATTGASLSSKWESLEKTTACFET